MKIKIIADYAENFNEFENSRASFNDHMYESEIIYIKDAICKLGYECTVFGGIDRLIDAYSKKETFKNTLFLNFSDGLSQNYSRLQAPILCELLNVKYSGSRPFSVALMNNKHYSKLAVKEIGVFIPNGVLITNIEELNGIHALTVPIIVKPNTGGSSDGITQDCVKFNALDAVNKAKELLLKGYEVIAEEYIVGYEVTTLIIGNKNDFRLNETVVYEFSGNLIHKKDVLDAHSKANNDRKGIMACNLFSPELCKKIEKISERIFFHLDAVDMARIDYRITEKGDVYFIEINSQPGINKFSEGGYICKHKNITFSDLYNEYINTCLTRYGLINHD